MKDGYDMYKTQFILKEHARVKKEVIIVDTPSKTRLKQEKDSLVTEKPEPLDRRRGKHPNSQANLKPFEKGISGNPSGRPTKHQKFKEALMKHW